MTVETAGALGRYFETLYTLNQNLIVLCGADIFDHVIEFERRVDEVVTSIPRLVPYSYNHKAAGYEIIPSDGLMKFSQDLPFLGGEYEKILQKHVDFLEKVKKVRNKLEHEIHGAQIVGSSSGNTSLFSVTYRIGETDVCIRASEIMDFVKDMNILFSKLQGLVKQFAYDNQYSGHPYFRRLVRCDFADFNRILESDLLYYFGKTLQVF